LFSVYFLKSLPNKHFPTIIHSLQSICLYKILFFISIVFPLFLANLFSADSIYFSKTLYSLGLPTGKIKNFKYPCLFLSHMTFLKWFIKLMKSEPFNIEEEKHNHQWIIDENDYIHYEEVQTLTKT